MNSVTLPAPSLDLKRIGKVYHLHCEQHFRQPVEKVFPFFADAFNLQRITPPFLKFRVTTPAPIAMHEGTLIDYRLRLHGLPFAWRTQISLWEPPHQFVDQQLRGPYRQWVHLHVFQPDNGGTKMLDHVQYVVPLGEMVHRLMVRKNVINIFQYRQRKLTEIFGGH